ncbi:hypothetical protein [Luteibacter sp. UNCMF366Tsu5.1]|uniref:hypothetical protein n=1 Tax=Luteibacter sp. UNCMF366Tsu5.1 TaxID=1502758 RepID=UPI0009087CF0|nr:hypothetical protein [Luteibacter sp. UNCMF366Tsu5.1]SFW20267.1 hypothetical protein SAMN02800691_0249 [Luteibacter sp. UNCMF366Tsu5.1]
MANRATCVFSVLAIGALSLSASSTASGITWPELPKDCFVRSRPATQADAKRGCAVFVIEKGGVIGGMPMDIQIPQYAWHIDQPSAKRTAVILIQAEESSGIKAVGYREVSSHSLGAALLSEMILLGTDKPD